MISPNEPWFGCLAPCEAMVPCGQGRHVVRWEAGALRLASHADPEAELVLAALGGGKARCVEVAEAWARHAADLTMLGVGPRGPADEILVSWDDVDAAAQAAKRGGWTGYAPLAGATPHGPMHLASPPAAAAMARVSARRALLAQEAEEARQRRNDLLSLLALGYGFQVRLTGQVVAAHADRLDEQDERGRSIRPVLAAALAGRLAPVAEQWLGIDPDQVVVSLHRGPGWGSVELTGRGEERRLRVSLPAEWLARVWAAGLTLAGGISSSRCSGRAGRTRGCSPCGRRARSRFGWTCTPAAASPVLRMPHTGRHEPEPAGRRGARRRGRGPGAGAALGPARHRQDVRDPRAG